MKLSLQSRRSLTGLAFTSPFIVGFALFFLYPFIQSMFFSLNELKVTADGYVLSFVGLSNYRTLLLVDESFRRVFVQGMLSILVDIPLVLMFSFFAATLLNQKFRGRLLARIIFFLPVVIGAEITLKVENAVYMGQAMDMARQGLFDIEQMARILGGLKLPSGFIKAIVDVVNMVPEIIRSSGVQILVFLAALQSIPESLFEAARIEGATGWECFWRITFPILSGLFLVNVVYTIIDSFTSPTNEILALISGTMWSRGYGLSIAMAWFYFASVIAIIGVAMLVTSRNVYYES